MMLIKLQYPIKTAEGKTIREVQMRRATRGDMKAANRYSQDVIEQEDFLFARLTGLVPEDIDLFDMADSRQLTDSFRRMADLGDGTEAIEETGRDIARSAPSATG